MSLLVTMNHRRCDWPQGEVVHYRDFNGEWRTDFVDSAVKVCRRVRPVTGDK